MRPLVLLFEEVHDGLLARLAQRLPQCDFLDAQAPEVFAKYLPMATITYARPKLEQLADAKQLRWIQMLSAGVPRRYCAAAQERGITLTSLSGLYGPSIAEHTLALMSLICRNLHVALRQQHARHWDQELRHTMQDLQGKTAAIVGVGDIGQAIARLCQAYGMRVVGCRRTPQPTPHVDRIYPVAELTAMLAVADHIIIAAPLTDETEGLLDAAALAACKRGAFLTNVSRGAIVQEEALLAALRSGQLAGAALDVFAVEPLPAEHPFWTMPNVVVSPHYSGDTVNRAWLPCERFMRNLHAWLEGRPLEGVVDLRLGY